ncbi:hypothetical protein WJX84_010509 [Apatococcus fuscideae]|uniref:Uncharacterized protein n=1 Tax=Apatococcus fuscideae TaxID=2026836 RepID=A0AAW1SSN7_9CHLO
MEAVKLGGPDVDNISRAAQKTTLRSKVAVLLFPGLRAYLWQQKTEKEQIKRELWGINGVGYQAYRASVSEVKELGISEHLHPRRIRRSTIESNASDLEVSSSYSSFSTAAQYAFAGMKAVFHAGEARITVLAFGSQDSTLLAWGDSNGTVCMATLQEPGQLLHELHEHKGQVTDVDWSQDSSLLLSASEDCHAALWNASLGNLVRTLRCNAPVTCASFHQVNQNLVMLGTAAGDIDIFNCSTGIRLQRIPVQPGGGVNSPGLQALVCTNSSLFAADSRGCVHTFRWEINARGPQKLKVLHKNPLPGGKQAEVASMSLAPYCAFTHGPCLLLSTSDSFLTVYRIQDSVGKLEVRARVQMPPAARKLRAAMCPMLQVDTPEYVTMGGEDTAVYIYDISGQHHKGAKVVNKLQGHMAPVLDVAWSSNEMLLASGLAELDCQILDAA